jgi:plastocyanin
MDPSVNTTRRILLASGATALGTALAGCLGGSGSENTVMAGTNEQSFAFVPEEITVSVGTTVTWEWGTDQHNIVVQSQPDGASWPGEEEVKDEGYEYSYTFEVPGSYEYICEPHAPQMVGAVVVEE